MMILGYRLNQVPLEPSTRITKLLNKGISTLAMLDGKNYKNRTARTRLIIRVARGIGFIGTFLKVRSCVRTYLSLSRILSYNLANSPTPLYDSE